MVERNGLVSGVTLVTKRHRIAFEVFFFVDGGGQIHGVRDSEPERRDLFGMGGEEFGHDHERMHAGDDPLCHMIQGIDLYRPLKAPHHLVGVEFRGVDVDGSNRAHFGQQCEGRRNDVGDIPIARTVQKMGMILDVDEPQISRTNPPDAPQAHGLVEVFDVTTVQVFGRRSEGFNMQLIGLA